MKSAKNEGGKTDADEPFYDSRKLFLCRCNKTAMMYQRVSLPRILIIHFFVRASYFLQRARVSHVLILLSENQQDPADS